MFSKNYAPIYPFGHPSSQTYKISTEKIAEHVKPISEILEHLKLPSNDTICVGRHKDAGFVVSRRKK